MEWRRPAYVERAWLAEFAAAAMPECSRAPSASSRGAARSRERSSSQTRTRSSSQNRTGDRAADRSVVHRPFTSRHIPFRRHVGLSLPFAVRLGGAAVSGAIVKATHGSVRMAAPHMFLSAWPLRHRVRIVKRLARRAVAVGTSVKTHGHRSLAVGTSVKTLSFPSRRLDSRARSAAPGERSSGEARARSAAPAPKNAASEARSDRLRSAAVAPAQTVSSSETRSRSAAAVPWNRAPDPQPFASVSDESRIWRPDRATRSVAGPERSERSASRRREASGSRRREPSASEQEPASSPSGGNAGPTGKKSRSKNAAPQPANLVPIKPPGCFSSRSWSCRSTMVFSRRALLLCRKHMLANARSAPDTPRMPMPKLLGYEFLPEDLVKTKNRRSRSESAPPRREPTWEVPYLPRSESRGDTYGDLKGDAKGDRASSRRLGHGNPPAEKPGEHEWRSVSRWVHPSPAMERSLTPTGQRRKEKVLVNLPKEGSASWRDSEFPSRSAPTSERVSDSDGRTRSHSRTRSEGRGSRGRDSSVESREPSRRRESSRDSRGGGSSRPSSRGRSQPGEYRDHDRGSAGTSRSRSSSARRDARSNVVRDVLAGLDACQRLRPKPAESKLTALKKEVRSSLNKLSPDNETAILSQLTRLQVQTMEDLSTVSDLLMDKALGDPFYSAMYARATCALCAAFPDVTDAHTSDTTETAAGSCASFKDTVLAHVQRLFGGFFDGPGMEGDEPEETLQRKRALAYMRLLGHLHIQGVASIDLLQMYVVKLLQPKAAANSFPQPSWIECACEMLHTVGRHLLATAPGKRLLKFALDKLSHWKDLRQKAPGGDPAGGRAKPIYQSRIKFLILDTIEAHVRGWPIEIDAKAGSKQKCVMPSAGL